MRTSVIATVLFLLTLLAPAQAQIRQEGVRVAVFPFTFYSSEDLGHLTRPLMLLINKRLASEGMESVDAVEVIRVMAVPTAGTSWMSAMTTCRTAASTC